MFQELRMSTRILFSLMYVPCVISDSFHFLLDMPRPYAALPLSMYTTSLMSMLDTDL